MLEVLPQFFNKEKSPKIMVGLTFSVSVVNEDSQELDSRCMLSTFSVDPQNCNNFYCFKESVIIQAALSEDEKSFF